MKELRLSRRRWLAIGGLGLTSLGLGYIASRVFVHTPSVATEQSSYVDESSFIIFEQPNGTYGAKNGTTGQVEFVETDATKLFNDVKDVLKAQGGGLVFVKSGTYHLSETYPDEDIWDLITIRGEGPTTKIVSSAIDALDLTRVRVKSLSFTDATGKEWFVAENDVVGQVPGAIVFIDGNYAVSYDGKGRLITRKSNHADALQDVFDYLSNAGETVVLLGRGLNGITTTQRYPFSFQIDKTVYVKSPVSIIGLGDGRTNIFPTPDFPTTVETPIIDFGTYGGSKYLVHLYGLRFDYTDVNGTNHPCSINMKTVKEPQIIWDEFKGFKLRNIQSDWGIIANSILYEGTVIDVLSGTTLRIVNNDVDGFFSIGNLNATTTLFSSIVITGNIFKNARSWLQFYNAGNALIAANRFQNASYRAVRLQGSYTRYIDIAGNLFDIQDSQARIISIESGSISDVYIHDNVFLNAGPSTISMFPGATVNIKRNFGYATEMSGTAIIPAGQTRVKINHGLATMPTKVFATPMSNPGTIFWVSDVASTSFVINILTAQAIDVIFSWYAEA